MCRLLGVECRDLRRGGRRRHAANHLQRQDNQRRTSRESGGEEAGTNNGRVPKWAATEPDVEKRRLDNPLTVPNALSFLTYQRWKAEVKGLNDFPRELWPDNIPLLYFSYHIMVGLGTIFIAIMLLSAFLLWRRRLFDTRWALWILMLAFPFPYIANTAGWMTAEIGRQPWLVYGLLRTSDDYRRVSTSRIIAMSSPGVSSSDLMLNLRYSDFWKPSAPATIMAPTALVPWMCELS